MKECPRCHKITLEDEDAFNSLSRRDNKTYICNKCGDEEGYIDAGYLAWDKRESDFKAKVGKQTK